MSILSKIMWRGKTVPERPQGAAHKNYLQFLREAALEIDELIKENPNWYQDLPYNASMSPEEARELEIEKRAIWRRVIYDAQRSNLNALRWETSRDKKTCDACKALEGRVFFIDQYGELNEFRMHIGCRCNLIPVRDAKVHKA